MRWPGGNEFMKDLLSPTDFEEAHAQKGAMCGHGALAAALGVSVMAAMAFFDQGGWVNVPMMKDAIQRSGHLWQRVDKPNEGSDGVILIQWEGPWTRPGVPPAAACKYRHWIATRQGKVWDVNTQTWDSQDEWKTVVRSIIPERSTGFSVWGALLITPSRFAM